MCRHLHRGQDAGAWRNARHAAQWTATLNTHASPVMGRLPVRAVALPHVLEALLPIRQTRTATATGVRARLAALPGWAAANVCREGADPAGCSEIDIRAAA